MLIIANQHHLFWPPQFVQQKLVQTIPWVAKITLES